MRKILFLTQSPIGDRTFGGAIRANAIRDALAKIGCVYTLIINSGPDFTVNSRWCADRSRTAKFSRYGLSIRAFAERRLVGRWIGNIINNGGFDIIVVQYLDLALLVPRTLRSRIIYDPDDFLKTAPTGGITSLARRAKIAIRNTIALNVARQARHVWYVNPTSRPLPPNASRSNLPNIIAAPASSRERRSVVPGRILMVGHLLHGPNVEGLKWFNTNVFPQLRAARPDVELHVIGRHPQDLPAKLPGIALHGFVEDLSQAYDEAALVIAPIHSGAGTQIKVIDALAHGRPLVSSRFAHSGFATYVDHGVHLLVAESVCDWIKQSLWALDHQQEAEAMARAGEKVVRASFGQDSMDMNVGVTVERLGLTLRAPSLPSDAAKA